MRKKLVILLLLIISFVGMIALLFVINSEKTEKEVIIEYVELPDNEKVYLNGIVVSEEVSNSYVEAEYSNLLEMNITNGSQVKEGQVLYKCQNDTITLQIEELKEQIDTYNSEINRYKESNNKLNQKIEDIKKEINELQNNNMEVSNDSIGNDARIESYNTQIQGYKEQIDNNNQQIGMVEENISRINNKINKISADEYKEIKSQINGVAYLSSDSSISEIPNIVIYSDKLLVNAEVDEKSKDKLIVGKEVQVKIISNKKTIKGIIKSVSSQPNENANLIDSNTLSKYKVEISIENQDNLSRGYHVQIVSEVESKSIEIPSKAVFTDNNKSYVYKKVDNDFVKTEISCEESYKQGYVNVSSGITNKDKIILNVKEYIMDGNKNE